MTEINQFLDKKQRKIILKVDEALYSCIAYHNETQIGKFEYDIHEDEYDDYIFIQHMNIDGKYQRSGIGTQIIKSLIDFYGLNIVFPRPYYENPEASFYLIDNGPVFAQAFQGKKSNKTLDDE